MENVIRIKGARQHNLKNINVDIPKNKFIVFTGVSGSGKSSLAFDTIYAEGQRRYVESLSTYARQFLGIMEKPDVDLIEGLSPSISIDQKTTSRNPRSTVGTVTEIYDYLRLLYARIGHPHCPVCQREISRQSVDQIVDSAIQFIDSILKYKMRIRFFIMSPIVIDRKGEFSSLFDNLKAKGFTQVRVDKQVRDLKEELLLIKTNRHSIDAIVDKLSLIKKDFKDIIYKENLKKRLSDSIEQSLKLSDGLVILSEVLDKSFDLPQFPKSFRDHLFSEKFACPYDNVQIPEIEPRTFSFNSPHGACELCSGLGKILKVDPNLIFSDEISITEGGIFPFSNMFEHDTWYSRLILQVCSEKNINPKIPIKYLSKENKQILLYGTYDEDYRVKGTNRFGKMTHIYEAFTGIVSELKRRYKNTQSEWVRGVIEKYMREMVCPDCNGARLKKEALNVTIKGISISQLTKYDIEKSIKFFTTLISGEDSLSQRELEIGKLIINEINLRLGFLSSVGLEYLSLDRPAGSLSGGEAQRIRLASQIGSGLTGVLYVLDEPTIGLHQKDNQRLIESLKKLKNLGNTVITVEHDREMITQADHVIDFGPSAGKKGGEIVFEGSPEKIKKSQKSLTGKYLSGKKNISVPSIHQFEISDKDYILLSGANLYNLKNLRIKFPLKKFVVITGVSGSGKSTLLVETLYPALMQKINPKYKAPASLSFDHTHHSEFVEGRSGTSGKLYNGEVSNYRNIEGFEKIDKVILIDQSPIGRTPRSNPATYTKLFDHIRVVFSETREAKAMGFKKGRFSFNVKGGRCENCEGQGQIKIEMQFMSDIWIKCDICKGKRYNSQTLEVVYKGKNISDILNLTVDEAKEFFHAHPKIIDKIDTLQEVGLGYIELGQPATTLSGGEAQRVKLSSELSKKETGNTLYILDEPTTGLHFSDLEKLLKVLKLLVFKGNTVMIIEHNMDIIKNADWIIDLGPEGGEKGGYLVAEGMPNQISKIKESYTGKYLQKL